MDGYTNKHVMVGSNKKFFCKNSQVNHVRLQSGACSKKFNVAQVSNMDSRVQGNLSDKNITKTTRTDTQKTDQKVQTINTMSIVNVVNDQCERFANNRFAPLMHIQENIVQRCEKNSRSDKSTENPCHIEQNYLQDGGML